MPITIMSAGDKAPDADPNKAPDADLNIIVSEKPSAPDDFQPIGADADFDISTVAEGGDSDAPELPQKPNGDSGGPLFVETTLVMRPDELQLLIDLMYRHKATGQVTFLSSATRRAFEKLRNYHNIMNGSLAQMHYELQKKLNDDFDAFVRDVVKPVRPEREGVEAVPPPLVMRATPPYQD